MTRSPFSNSNGALNGGHFVSLWVEEGQGANDMPRIRRVRSTPTRHASQVDSLSTLENSRTRKRR